MTGRVWPIVAAWAAFYVLTIVVGGLMFGGAAAVFAAIAGGGLVIGTTDVWGHVQAAEDDRDPGPVRIDL